MSLSTHLLESFEQQRQQQSIQIRARFQAVNAEMTNVLPPGGLSFNANMHGNTQSFSLTQPLPASNNQSFSDTSQLINTSMSTLERIATLQAKLHQKLGPEYVSQRPAPGGGKLSYIEGWKIIALANEVFGFNGWCSNIISLSVDYADYMEESKRYNVGVTAIVRVTLPDGVYHEDVGYGVLENSKSKGAALDKCKKEAVTDGLKRALRNFGNLMGNCLYDKAYATEVVKIKVTPAKLDKNTLHRRPEFDDRPNASTSSAPALAPAVPPPPAPVKHEMIPPKPIHAPPPLQQQPARLNPMNNNAANTSASSSSSVSRPLQARQHISAPVPAAPKESSSDSITSCNSRPGAYPTPGSDRSAPQRAALMPGPNDSFDHVFPSSDDAFLADVDLGDPDLGRPILDGLEAKLPPPVRQRQQGMAPTRPAMPEGRAPGSDQDAFRSASRMVPAAGRQSAQVFPMNAPMAPRISNQPRAAASNQWPGRQQSSVPGSNMSANQIQNQNRPLHDQPNQNIMAGIKRGADGVQRQAPIIDPGTRMPLTDLQIGLGGDVKRVRR